MTIIVKALRGNVVMLEKYPDVLTVKDIMCILHIGKNSAYKLINENQVYYIKVGKNIRIPKKSLISYILKYENVCYTDGIQSVTSQNQEVII